MGYMLISVKCKHRDLTKWEENNIKNHIRDYVFANNLEYLIVVNKEKIK